jgi:thiamine-monophosphate kinase
MPLIGGDTNESPQMVLDGTALGSVDKNNVMMKSKTAQGSAKPGDLLAVTGVLGLAAAGFEFLLSPNYPEFPKKSNNILKSPNSRVDLINIIKKHALQPRARIKEGIMAAESGMIKGATDITDGLASELEEIIKAANSFEKEFVENYDNSASSKHYELKPDSRDLIGLKIHEELLPVPLEVKKIAEIFDKDLLNLALYYGEDFELLLIIEKESVEEFKKILDIYLIGEITDSGVIEIVTKNGDVNILSSGGYEHLK